MLVATCNRLFQISSETRTIETDDSIGRRYASDTERDWESYTEVCAVCLSHPIILDVQARLILTRAHLDRVTPSRVMRHRNTSSRIMGNAAIATKPWPWCFNSKSLIDSVHEPVEQQAFPAGKAARTTASLRVLSSLRTTQKSKIARFPSAGGLELGTHRLWLD